MRHIHTCPGLLNISFSFLLLSLFYLLYMFSPRLLFPLLKCHFLSSRLLYLNHVSSHTRSLMFFPPPFVSFNLFSLISFSFISSPCFLSPFLYLFFLLFFMFPLLLFPSSSHDFCDLRTPLSISFCLIPFLHVSSSLASSHFLFSHLILSHYFAFFLLLIPPLLASSPHVLSPIIYSPLLSLCFISPCFLSFSFILISFCPLHASIPYVSCFLFSSSFPLL